MARDRKRKKGKKEEKIEDTIEDNIEDIPTDEEFKIFLEQLNSVYILEGFNPTSTEYKTKTCSFVEWNILISIYCQMFIDLNRHQNAELTMAFFLQPEFNYPKDNMEYNFNQMLQKEGYLPPRREAAINNWKGILSLHGKSLNFQETQEHIKDLFEFVVNNPGGFNGKLVAMSDTSGPWRIPPSDDPVEEVKAEVFKSMVEDTFSDAFQQILIGTNPISETGKSLSMEKSYWRLGFSSLCTFSMTKEIGNPELSNKFLERSMTATMGDPTEIDSEINEYLKKYLEELLTNQRSIFIEMVLRNWENPQANQYALSNEGKFNEQVFIDSMQNFLGFMKTNTGFKT